MENIKVIENISAARVVASTFGIIVGLAGIDHGFFEILQGNTATNGLMIYAIGPAQRFWEYGFETALTIVPNFLVTGILAVFFGLLVMLWAGFFVHRKHGGWILLSLSIILFLVGGGFAPIFVSILASLAAARIDKPVRWWRKLLPGSVLNFLGKFWRGILIIFVIVFVISVEIAIFGWPLTAFFDADTSMMILNTLAYIMLGLMVLSVLTAFANDSRQQAEMELLTR
jgi:hypothetical protein